MADEISDNTLLTPNEWWADIIQRASTLHGGAAGKLLASKLATKWARMHGNESLDVAMIDGCLAGKTMPESQQQLETFLDVLSLPTLEEAMASGQNMQIGLAVKRQQFIASWESFSPQQRTKHIKAKPVAKRLVPLTTVTGNGPARKASAGAPFMPQSEPEGSYEFHDSPHIPPRRYDGYAGYNKAYKDLAPNDLERLIVGDSRNGTPDDCRTLNVHEYMTATRLYNELTLRDVGTEFGHGERGEHMPSWVSQERFREMFPKEADRFEELAISNALDMAHAAKAAGEYQKANAYVRYLAPHYWQEALREANDPDANAGRSDKPSWYEKQLPIATQGEYLRAARKAMGIEITQAAKIVGYTPAGIHDAENGRDMSEEAKQKMLGTYRDIELEKRQKNEILPNVPILVNEAIYDAKTVQTRLSSKRDGHGVV